MSVEQYQEAKVVLRDSGGAEISSLDVNHDHVVTMQELNAPRPEDGHDLVITGVAGLAVAAVLIATATIESARRIRRN